MTSFLIVAGKGGKKLRLESVELPLATLTCGYMLQDSSLQLPDRATSFNSALSVGRQITVFYSYTETGTLLDVLVWLYCTIMVQIGRKIAVSANAGSRVG